MFFDSIKCVPFDTLGSDYDLMRRTRKSSISWNQAWNNFNSQNTTKLSPIRAWYGRSVSCEYYGENCLNLIKPRSQYLLLAKWRQWMIIRCIYDEYATDIFHIDYIHVFVVCFNFCSYFLSYMIQSSTLTRAFLWHRAIVGLLYEYG